MAMEMETERRNRLEQPSEQELEAFMQSQAERDQPHDPTNPAHVTRELMREFGGGALYVRDGRTYVQYQQVIRRLIHATGNRFSTQVLDVQERPWGKSKNGTDMVLIEATVALTIPVLDSTRTHRGVQVASVGYGEDMRKGAVSDALKKAAQEFGVAIDLAGADGEDTAPHDVEDMHGAAQMIRQSAESRRQQQGQPVQVPAHQNVQTSPHRANTYASAPTTGKRALETPRTDRQGKALWKISGANRDVIAGWCAEYGVTSDRDLTEAQAAEIITKYGG